MDIRGKEITPRETIENAKRIFDKLGLGYRFERIDSGANTFSHELEIYFKDMPEYTIHSSGGKGITEEYSMASAVGEMIEELSNLILLWDIDYTKLDKYKEKYVSVNEKVLNIKEVLKLNGYIKELREKYGDEIIKKHFESGIKITGKDAEVCLKLTNIKDDTTCYIPFSHLTYETNGMCAGNTEEEALCQGIFELFERFSHNHILKNKINCPLLPEHIYEETKSMGIIKKIESYDNNRYKISIKDCSLGLGIPIVGIIIFDKKNKKYKTSFGCSYSYNIALERCLTELLQTATVGTIQTMEIFSNKNEYDKNNIVNMCISGEAIYPDEFLSDLNPAYEFKEDINLGKDNKEIFENISKIIKKNNINLYYLDSSFLGINSYKIMSVDLVDGALLGIYDNTYVHKGTYKNLDSEKITLKEAENKLNDILYGTIDYGNIPNIIGVTNDKEFKNKDCTPLLDLLTSVLAIKTGDIEMFLKYSGYFLDSYNGENIDGKELLKCLRHLYMYNLKGTSLEITVDILKKIYEEDIIKTCISSMGNFDNIIKLFGFFDRNGNGKFNLCNIRLYNKYVELIKSIRNIRIDNNK